MNNTALVVGATGIVGSALIRELQGADWAVHGLARSPAALPAGVGAVAADLRDAQATRDALAGLAPTHVFITTWSRQANEAENIRVNAAMVRHLLDALRDRKSTRLNSSHWE